jgi:hypothetical protein
MDTATQLTLGAQKADLIQVDHALESFRDAGYDLPAAVGEVVDNSIEARAQHVNIETFEIETNGRKRGKQRTSIESIAFADDGVGIPPEILPNSLTMGFSTRYNQRNGLGRFGVGAKLAALSQAKRVDIYTRPVGSFSIYHTYLDLVEIQDGVQKYLEAEPVTTFPEQYAHLMFNAAGESFESGTLVIWSKVDRLEEGGRFGSSVDERLATLMRYLGRTYRYFIAKGFKLALNGRAIDLLDPLFLLKNPRADELLEGAWQADIIEDSTATSEAHIEIDGHEVTVRVTLLPKAVRLKRGEGGVRGSAGRFREWHIDENQGRVSIVRQGREIYYDIVPRLFPGRGVTDPDRFIGVEVSFPAALDEYFQVRHVKRGAEPVDKLRQEIRRFLAKPIEVARKRINDDWSETDVQDQANESVHQPALDALKKVEETAPRGIGGADVSPEQADLLLTQAAEDLAEERGIAVEELPQEQKDETLAQLKSEIREESFVVLEGAWPGHELFEITHLNGRVILRLNWRHPFMRDVYRRVRDLAEGKLSAREPEELEALGRRLQGAIDVLLFSYARAENMHRHPDEQYRSLRGYWGQFLVDGVRQLLNDQRV